MAVTQALRTLDQYLAWVKAHPTKHQGGAWATTSNSWCEQLVNNAGGFSQAFPTAYDAAKASGGLDPRPETAKPGEFVYWGGGAGHVGLVIRQGWMLCASQLFLGNGSGVGEISFDDYSKKHPSMHWLGHSPRHGSQTLKKVSTTPVQAKPPTVVKPPPIDPVPARPHNRGTTLNTGDVLDVGDYLVNGSVHLVVGNNGIMAEYRGSQLLWNTSLSRALKVGAYSKTYAVLQSDGNFVLYGFDKKGKKFALWASGTTAAKYRKAGNHVTLAASGHLYVQPTGATGKTIVGG